MKILDSAKKNIITVVLLILPVIAIATMLILGAPNDDGSRTFDGEYPTYTEQQKENAEQTQKNVDEEAAKLLGVDIQQDGGNGNDVVPQMGASAYYKVDVSTPTAFYNAVNGRGFNEGYGMQCVAGFKEFMYSLSGRYVATATGGASGYANQQSQIEPLGFKWHAGASGLQDGDWAIFGGGKYGHVAMRYQGKWFGQNQGAANSNVGNAFNLLSFGTQDVIGYYRPNIYQGSTPTPSPTPTPEPTPTPSATSYTVRRGDTLGGISLEMGWWPSVNGLYGDDGYAQRLAEKNNILSRGLIYPGQILNKAE